jgi:SurA N-terminal domain/PPIC-type PPIASE domain
MITQLRGMLKSHVYRVFLWVFLAVLLFGGMSFDFSDNKPWVIKIYKQKTTELEFRHAITASQRQYDYLKAQGISWPRTETIEKEVLRRVVSNGLMHHVAHDLHLAIPSILLQEQLHGQLASLPAYFFDANGQLIVEMLEKVIAPKTFDTLLADMENEIKTNLLNNIISIGSHVPQFEVAMQCNEEFANKTYSILTFSLSKSLAHAKEKKVSDETLERFYKKSEHGDLYKTVEKRSGHYWKFNAQDYGLIVSKSDVAAYYDKHKQSNYVETPAQVQVHRIFFGQDNDETTDSRAQAQIIYDELQKDPSTFAAVAKKVAAAKLAHQGSEKTEFFSKDSKQYDKILVATAFEQLAQDGDISPVIKTDKGYEVLQRIARKSAKYKSLSSVESEIQEKLLQEKFAKRFKQDADRLVSNATYNKEGLASFIEKRHGRKETIALEAKKPGIMIMQLFQTEQGNYAVFMADKEGILLECIQVDKKALKSFEDIKSTVSHDYYTKQAQQDLQTIALDAMKDAAAMNFAQLAKKYDAHLEVAHVAYKNGHMDIPAMLRKPEVAQKIKALQSAGAMIDVVTAQESYLIALDELAPVDQKLFEEKKQAVEMTLVNKAKYKGRDSFIASLYRHATLIDNEMEIKEQLLKDIKDIAL